MDTSLYKPLLYIRKNKEDSYIDLDYLNISEKSKLIYKGNIFPDDDVETFLIGSGSGDSDDFAVGISHLQYGDYEVRGKWGKYNQVNYLPSDFNINDIVELEFNGEGIVKVNNQIIINVGVPTIKRSNIIICGAKSRYGFSHNFTLNYKSIQQYIYQIKLYEDGTALSYDFIPCKRLSDNVVGMYDKVHDKFYPPTQGTFYEPIIMDDIKSLTIPEGNVTKIEDNEGRVLWSALPDPNKYAYGIRWDHTVPDS